VIIALTGPQGSGKDTAARFLCEAWSDSARGVDLWGASMSTTLAIADPLRHAADALGVPKDVTRERKDDREHPALDGGTGREFLLNLGRLVRGYFGDLLAGHAVARALAAERLCVGRLVVVTDVRREVEARLLVEAGARLLHVDRGINPAADLLLGGEWAGIVALRPVVLSNRGTCVDLTAACRAVVDALRAEVRP
jgi:hypothetical protein